MQKSQSAPGLSCVDAPQFCKVIFNAYDGLALLSLVCQASCCGLILPRAGMQFEERVPHRFREL